MLRTLGKILAGLYAFCCGVTASGVFVGMHLIGLAPVLYAIVGILFIATLYTNYRMCKTSVPEVLLDIFGKEQLFQGLFETKDGNPLSQYRRYLISMGLFLAISVGVTSAALNFFGTLALGGMFALGAMSILVPPLAVILAMLVFIVLTALMLKSIAVIVKTDNLFLTCKNKLYDLIDTNPELNRNKNKSYTRIILERIATVSLFVLILPLSIAGLFMTINACANGLSGILLKIPQAIPSVVYYTSKVISFGFAFLGWLPFVVRTSVITASNIFEPLSNPTEIIKSNTAYSYFLNSMSFLLRIISSLGNGIVAMHGAQGSLMSALAVTGGTVNSFAASAYDPPANQNKRLLSKPEIFSSVNNETIELYPVKDIELMDVQDTPQNIVFHTLASHSCAVVIDLCNSEKFTHEYNEDVADKNIKDNFCEIFDKNETAINQLTVQPQEDQIYFSSNFDLKNS